MNMEHLHWFFSMRFFWLLAAVGAMILDPTGQARADYVVNGSFETPQLPNSQPYSGNGNDIAPWTRSGLFDSGHDQVLEKVGDTGLLGTVSTAADGDQFAVLGDHNNASGQAAYLSQTLHGLTAGDTYTLTFYIAPQGWGTSAQNITVDFPTGSSTAAQTFTSALPDGKYWDNWTKETENFVAASSSVDLRFTSTTQYEIGLDGVSVVNAADSPVPEPATAVLALTGVLGLAGGSWLRRKRIACIEHGGTRI